MESGQYSISFGPLANPAEADVELLGVYSEELVEPMAHVLDKLGVKRALVVYGQDRLDEISLSAPTTVMEVILNAGAGIYLMGGADSIAAGIQKARETIANGKAYEKLLQFVALTNEEK